MARAYSLAVERSIREWFARHQGLDPKLVQDAAEPSPEIYGAIAQAMKSIESSANADVQKIERIQGARAAGGAKLLAAFRSRNVALIKTVDEETKAKLDAALAKWGNLHVNDLTDKLLEVADVSRSRARFWARDQTLKLSAAITRSKHESLGIVEYVWRTSNDGTVRESHAELNNRTFRYDDPPETGTGVHNPGEDYQCRCHADPVLETAIDPRDIVREPEAKRAERASESAAKRAADLEAKRTAKRRKAEADRAAKEAARRAEERRAVERRARIDEAEIEAKRASAAKQSFAQRAGATGRALRVLSEQRQGSFPVGEDASGTVRHAVREPLAHVFPAARPRYSCVSNRLQMRTGATDPVLQSAHGYHDWGGDVVLTSDIVQRAAVALEDIAAGQGATADWMPVSTLFHEELHGFSRGLAGAYTGMGRILEEAGTELNARHMVQKLGGRVARRKARFSATGELSWELSTTGLPYDDEIEVLAKAVAQAFGESPLQARERFRLAWAKANYSGDGAELHTWHEVAGAVVDAMAPTSEQRAELLRLFDEMDRRLRAAEKP